MYLPYTGKLRKHAHVRFYTLITNAFVYSSLLTFLTVDACSGIFFLYISSVSFIRDTTGLYVGLYVHANRDTDIHYDCSACQTKIISIARLSVV